MATRDQIVKDARIKAQIEAQKMLEDAKAQIQHEKDNALLEIKGQVADLSLTIAEKVLLKQLDDAPAQSKMIDRMLDELVTNDRVSHGYRNHFSSLRKVFAEVCYPPRL